MDHVLPKSAIPTLLDDLRRRLQSLAMVDAILMADWEMRFFSYNSKWAPGESMAEMRDGQGSEFFFLFNTAGAAVKVYCHGSELSTNGASALAAVPREFSSFLHEEAFKINTATCYLWLRFHERKWAVAPASVVGIPLLAFIGDHGEYYRTWAENYYEAKIDASLIHAIFRHQPLDEELILSLNPNAEMKMVSADADEIGYPCGSC